MKAIDLLVMATHNLWQRRLRTALNLIGIVIGCILLLMTAAAAGGVQDAVRALFDSSEFARQIGVFPGGRTQAFPPDRQLEVVGEMSDARRERLRDAIITDWQNSQPRSDWRMTADELAALSEIPHVEFVIPEVFLPGRMQLDDQEMVCTIVGAMPDSDSMRSRVLAGRTLQETETNGVLIDEYLAYRIGFRSDQQLQDLIGREITVTCQISGSRASSIDDLLSENWGQLSQASITDQAQFLACFRKLMDELDATTLSDEQKKLLRSVVNQAVSVQQEPETLELVKTFKIRGVVRKGIGENVADLFRTYIHHFAAGEIYVHHKTAADMHLADPKRQQFYQALVSIDSTQNLTAVTAELENRGARAQSAEYILESIENGISRNSGIVYGIAAAVLLTAAIGISNTLIISVLERTPEFGILKSIGAKDSDLVRLMVIEGGILGAVGAAIAIICSWLLAFGGHFLLEWYVESRLDSDVSTNLFQFTILPAILVMLIAIAICAAGSILPAYRAARLDPVTAMRRT